MVGTNLMNWSSTIFNYQICLNNRSIWKNPTARTTNVDSSLSRRIARIPLLLLPSHSHLRPHHLQIRHCFLLPRPHLPPLLRSHQPPLSPPMSSVADSSTPSNSTSTVRVVVKGRVQGVFYRDWTVQNATELGLKGWVRNRRDGTVEALFSGSSDKVKEMEQRCRRGPPASMVTGLEVLPSDDDPGATFERRQTV